MLVCGVERAPNHWLVSRAAGTDGAAGAAGTDGADGARPDPLGVGEPLNDWGLGAPSSRPAPVLASFTTSAADPALALVDVWPWLAAHVPPTAPTTTIAAAAPS